MERFTYYSPTEIVFGRGAQLQAAEKIKKFGGSRVMIIYGGGSVVKSGLLDTVEQLLGKAGLPYTVLGGVKPNPRLSLARAGVKEAIRFGADFILAIGGGSVIDTAKAIAHGAANPEADIWLFWTKEAKLVRSTPVGVILTISAAGSETSDSAVITNEETGSKRGLNSELNRPRFAIMNPELTFTLPRYQVTCGVVDIMMHTMERFFTLSEGNEITDEIAASLLRVVIRNGKAAAGNTQDYQAMSELMWCGSLSHNGLTGLGGVPDFATHQLGHELSAKFDVAHGASLSAVWGSWAEYVCPVKPERFALFAEKVWGIKRASVGESARAGVEKTVSYFSSLGMPTCFTELGIGVQSDRALRELAKSCMFGGTRTIGQFKVLDAEDAYSIYRSANR